MRRSLALTGASVIGVGAAVAGAAPAQADPVIEPACTDVSEHQVTVGTLNPDWFMDCVPQYGVGKGSFTLTSTETLPDELLPLDDPAVTATYSGGGPAAAAYFGTVGETNGFTDFGNDGSKLDYSGRPIVKISGVEAIAEADLPAACQVPTLAYQHAYRVDYEPTTVTFSQEADGRTWVATVSLAPGSVYLGLNFEPADAGDPDPNVTTGNFDSAAAQCVVHGTGVTALGADDSEGGWATATDWALVGSTTMWPYSSGLFWYPLGEFPLASVVPVEEPGLPATGAESRVPLIAGGALLALGGALLGTLRLRRHRNAG